MKKLGITTPCKGRLHHLKRTAPFAVQECDTYCVVDYSCPDSCGLWIRETFPDSHVVSLPGRETFHKPEAHNAGVARLVQLGCDVVCLVDADTIIHPGLAALIRSVVTPGHFLIANHHKDLTGFLAVHTVDFEAVGGFDTVSYHGWGCEDLDTRILLYLRGCSYEVSPVRFLSAIEHENAERVAFYPESDKNQSAYRNLSILHTKFHNLTGNPNWHMSLEVSILLGGYIGDARLSAERFYGKPYTLEPQ